VPVLCSSFNIKFYESFTQIATLLPINAAPTSSLAPLPCGAASTFLATPTALPLPTTTATHLHPTPESKSARFCNFYIVPKCFRFNALIFILCREKIACSCTPMHWNCEGAARGLLKWILECMCVRVCLLCLLK